MSWKTWFRVFSSPFEMNWSGVFCNAVGLNEAQNPSLEESSMADAGLIHRRIRALTGFIGCKQLLQNRNPSLLVSVFHHCVGPAQRLLFIDRGRTTCHTLHLPSLLQTNLNSSSFRLSSTGNYV